MKTETTLFAELRHSGPRFVQLPDGSTWNEGVPPPDIFKKMEAAHHKHGFCMDHKKIIDAFMDIYEERHLSPVEFLDYHPLSDLMRRIGIERSPDNDAYVKDLINDLHYTFTLYHQAGAKKRNYVRVICNLGAEIDYEKNEFYIMNICFDEIFVRIYRQCGCDAR